MILDLGNTARDPALADKVADLRTLVVPEGLSRTPLPSHHSSGPIVMVAVPMLSTFWALMWSVDTFWNPLFFFGMWTGAALLMYAGGTRGHPGFRRHLLLMGGAIPIWWWFEIVNDRLGNWEYIYRHDYNSLEYFLLASLAFSTVVPALDSAWGLTLSRLRPPPARRGSVHHRGYIVESAAGVGLQVIVFAIPDLLFPLVWVAPFLICDGLVGYWGGRSFIRESYEGRWRLVVAIGLAGIICGVLWEFWNFWSAPKWVYHLPYFDFLHVFEMPLLGYVGYVPFAWSVYQLLHLRPFQRVFPEQT